MGEIARILKRYADRKVFKHLPRHEGAPPVVVWPDRTGSPLRAAGNTAVPVSLSRIDESGEL